MKQYCPSCPFPNINSFRLQLAKELIGEYCSRRRHGRGGTVIRPLPNHHGRREDTTRVQEGSMLHLTSERHQRGIARSVESSYVTMVTMPMIAL